VTEAPRTAALPLPEGPLELFVEEIGSHELIVPIVRRSHKAPVLAK
jgi:hypothetical protein